MCRFLAVAPDGMAPAAGLLADFRGQSDAAHAGGTRYWRHPDGWGITHSLAGASRHVARSTGDASTDPLYPAAVQEVAQLPRGGILLAHARRASHGNVALANTHPFVRDGWAFCHNGSVEGLSAPPGTSPAGTTDSELLFLRVLHEVRRLGDPSEALRAVAEHVDGRLDYSSLTCALTDGTAVWGLRKVGNDTADCGGRECALDFYTLARARLGGAEVLAQERTHLGLSDWRPLRDGEVVRVGVGAGGLENGTLATGSLPIRLRA